MLVAAINGKLRLKKTGLVEDEVTSTIFGPVADMSAGCAWNIIRIMSTTAGISEKLPSATQVDEVNAEFWPKHDNSPLNVNGTYVEPDVVFRFHFQDGTYCNVLLEVKWGATINPPCELVRQWTKRPKKTEQWIHIYLVTSEGRGKAECDKSIEILRKGCDNLDLRCCSRQPAKFDQPLPPNNEANLWKNHLGTISWRHVQQLAERLSRTEKPGIMQRWAKGVQCFLEHERYTPFIGFDWLKNNIYQTLDDESQITFFRKANRFWLSFMNGAEFAILEQATSQKYFMKRGMH
jgi:hypothetical protein